MMMYIHSFWSVLWCVEKGPKISRYTDLLERADVLAHWSGIWKKENGKFEDKRSLQRVNLCVLTEWMQWVRILV